jgi:hypothetical protein
MVEIDIILVSKFVSPWREDIICMSGALLLIVAIFVLATRGIVLGTIAFQPFTRSRCLIQSGQKLLVELSIHPRLVIQSFIKFFCPNQLGNLPAFPLRTLLGFLIQGGQNDVMVLYVHPHLGQTIFFIFLF